MIHFVTVVGSRLDLLPHTLRHYKDLGLPSLLVNIHTNSYNDGFYQQAVNICKDFGADIVAVFVGKWLQEVNPFLYRQTLRQQVDDWFIIADVDEFQVYPREISCFFSDLDRAGFDYVQGCVLDRLARNGGFPPVLPDSSLWDQYPLTGLLTPRILGASFVKIAAAKGYVRLSPGQHWARNGSGCPPEQEYIPVYHFKWSADVVSRLQARVNFYKAHNEAIWNESQRFLDYYNSHNGRIDITDPELHIEDGGMTYSYWQHLRKMLATELQQFRRKSGL